MIFGKGCRYYIYTNPNQNTWGDDMAQIAPSNLILRCYAHRLSGERWYGVCLDLNLAAEADSFDELKRKLHEMISSYFACVLDTNDKDSIPDLLSRKAPLIDWIKYYLIRLHVSIKKIPNIIAFKELIPFHLSNAC